MLNVQEAIQARRSIRKYLSDDVPDEFIEQMLDAARLAPSACNNQPWRFSVVKQTNVKREICHLLKGQRFVEEAPVVIVCFADLSRFSQEAQRNSWKELNECGIAQTLSGELAQEQFWEQRASAVPTRDQMVNSAVRNVFIAIEHLVLMATALGLGTCWLGVTDNPGFKRLFELPDNLVSVAVIPVGYPAGKIPSQRPRMSRDEMLIQSSLIDEPQK